MTTATIHLIPERAPLTTAHETLLLVLVLLAAALAGCLVGWVLEICRNRDLEERLTHELVTRAKDDADTRALALEREQLEAELAGLRRARPFDQERA